MRVRVGADAVFASMEHNGKLRDTNIVVQQPGGAGPVIAVGAPIGNGTAMGVPVATGGARPIVNVLPTAVVAGPGPKAVANSM